jgi:crossover junction endodeoxyribonuclease RusA
MNPLQVTLPWPPKELNPNASLHWTAKRKAARLYRAACNVVALQAGLRKGSVTWEGDIHVWIDFYPSDRRARDDDNLIAAFKAGRDGLADALGVDDKRFRIHPYVMTQIGGMVKVRLSPGPSLPASTEVA